MQVLSQLDNDIMKRTFQSQALKMELSSLLEDRKNLENETGSMYIVEDSPKAKAHRLITKSRSLQAEVDLPNKEKEKGRAENSPHGINNINTIMTANTKPQSEQQLGNAGTAEEISTQSTSTNSPGLAPINNQTDPQGKAKQK
jgi:hypothetical protein